MSNKQTSYAKELEEQFKLISVTKEMYEHTIAQYGAEGLWSYVDELQMLVKSTLEIIDGYEEILRDKRRLTRELDIALSGEENAAKQASLCDLIPLAKKMREELEQLKGKK